MNEQTVKCPICGDPYKFMPFYSGDQTACPDCVRKAESKQPKLEQWNHYHPISMEAK
jgi:hypothetical protein